MYTLHLRELNNLNYKKEEVIKNTFPKEIGSDLVQNINIQDGFSFLHTNYKFNLPLKIEAKQNSKNNFIIALSLKGNTKYKDKDKKEIDFKEGYSTISLTNNTEGFREIQNKEIEQIRLILSEEFLKRNFDNSFMEKYFYNRTKNINILKQSLIHLNSKIILNDLKKLNYLDKMDRLLIQGKVLQLLYYELNNLANKKTIKAISLNEYDKAAILKAKDILFEDFTSPPSIVELARLVHLNEFKLKSGFKELFGTSPYKLLLKYKMKHAKELLSSGEYNINEVSKLIGYEFTSSFTHAFFKEFGVLPKEVLKTRKYYY